MHSLYISYFGLREPLVQTQVLPYLRELRRGGVETSLLTFEPDFRTDWPAPVRDEWRDRLGREGLHWHALAYHKSPSLLATLYDIAAGTWTAAGLVRRHGIDVIHARNAVPALMGSLVKRAVGPKLVFDVRGFMAEEYVDAGTWPAGGHLFRLAKAAERHLLKVSDGFVVLTDRARDVLFPSPDGRPVEVIPCCVDLDRFEPLDGPARDRLRAELGLTGRRVIAYVGTLGGWYMTAEMAGLFAEAFRQDPSTHAMILTQSPAERIISPLRDAGLPDSAYSVRKVAPHDVPRQLAAADLAISFIRPCYSKLSSSPTKIAEYLAAGLPVLSTSGVGDVDTVLEDDRVGVIVREFDPESYRNALVSADALRLEPATADRCRATARERFDLHGVGGVRYRRLYERLAGVTVSPARRRAGSGRLGVRS